jgi:hypothetical protein
MAVLGALACKRQHPLDLQRTAWSRRLKNEIPLYQVRLVINVAQSYLGWTVEVCGFPLIG